jgi:hypothetical protein
VRTTSSIEPQPAARRRSGGTSQPNILVIMADSSGPAAKNSQRK